MNAPDKRFCELLGQVVRETRRSKGLSTRDVAGKMGNGVSKTTILNYENGSPAMIKKYDLLCKALGADPDALWDEANNRWILERDEQSYLAMEEEKISEYLSADQKKMLDTYDSLSSDNKQKLLSHAEFLQSQH